MLFRPFVARQFARPSGLAGLLMRPILNKVNARVNQTALDVLQLGPTDRLLDIGFGGGLMLQQASQCLTEGCAAGIEISEPMLRLARGKFRQEIQSGRVEVKQGSVSSIPYPDASFGAVSAVNTLHFWPDPLKGLKDIFRVLKPGGQLLIILRPMEYLVRIRFTSHGFTAYGDQELRELLDHAGFETIRIERRADATMGMQLALAVKPLNTSTHGM